MYGQSPSMPPAPLKEVVLVLPVLDQRVLMQLRDMKPEISSPGCWGFFGGAIDPGESALMAAQRELFEETGLLVNTILPLGFKRISDLGGLPAHSFCCRLSTPRQKINLQEGLDLALVSLNEIHSERIYSAKLKRDFPVVPSRHIGEAALLALQVIGDS